jgi:hypothetical protein
VHLHPLPAARLCNGVRHLGARGNILLPLPIFRGVAGEASTPCGMLCLCALCHRRRQLSLAPLPNGQAAAVPLKLLAQRARRLHAQLQLPRLGQLCCQLQLSMCLRTGTRASTRVYIIDLWLQHHVDDHAQRVHMSGLDTMNTTPVAACLQTSLNCPHTLDVEEL